MAFAISSRRRQHLPLLPLIFHLLFVATIFSLPNSSSATRKLMDLVQEQPLPMKYHHGPLLTGPISLNLIWYGKFKPSQRAVVTDFLTSLSSLTSSAQNQPSVAAWWKTVDKYQSQYLKLKVDVINGSPSPLRLTLGKQIMDENYSLGKSLKSSQLVHLAARGEPNNAINIVLTASDVAVEGFCTSRCGTHGSYPRGAQARKRGGRFAYIWVGNSEVQCPGQCAWPFHQPIYGPQSPPLVAPNNDVGLDGMVINIAGLVAGTVTNPFGNGYFQGPTDAPLEVGSACSGVYGKGSYPGYAGELLVDPATGSSYNAHGAHGRKYLLPALFDPSTSTCSPLV